MAAKKTKPKTAKKGFAAKKGKEAPNPIGRPTLYETKYCQMLIDHMSQGLSIEAFAGEIGVSKKTIYAWAEKYAEFLYAKQIGESKSALWWEKEAANGLWSSKEKGTFNTALWIFNMKNRHGWADKFEVNQDKTIHSVNIQLPGQQTERVISVQPGKSEELAGAET
jgi:DNA-binding XRE family transcriptional regulator